jgi:hypothetical protein
MDVTVEVMRKALLREAFGDFEPFVTGDDEAVESFYGQVLARLDSSPGVAVLREEDHYGSGYASYISAFLYPEDGSSRIDHFEYVETIGILLYLSRLAPIAVFGKSSRTQNRRNSGASFGFIGVDGLNQLPPGDWSDLVRTVESSLRAAHVELLPREPLLAAAPSDIEFPTWFDGSHHVFDTLFYWMD